jgi:hypothetical protein
MCERYRDYRKRRDRPPEEPDSLVYSDPWICIFYHYQYNQYKQELEDIPDKSFRIQHDAAEIKGDHQYGQNK